MSGGAGRRIPKIIHQTWKTKDVPAEWRPLAESWRRHHPDWEYRLWSDEECRQLVAERYPAHLPAYDGFGFGIQRADAARYLILHSMGGVYADLDIECLREMTPLIRDRSFVAALEPVGHEKGLGETDVVCNAFMAAAPGEPVMAAAAAELLRTGLEASTPGEIVKSTGPLMLTRVVRGLARDEDATLLPSSSVYPIANCTPELETLLAGGAPARELRKRLLREGSYAIHYWANSWCHDLKGELVNPPPYRVPGYRFYSGLDSYGDDLRNAGRDVTTLAAECDSEPRAVAFNTDGWMKHRVAPRARWRRMVLVGPGEGLYIKESAHPLWILEARDLGRRAWRRLARTARGGS